MTSKEKIIEKLKKNPQNLRYSEIEILFNNNDYVIREGKGSHRLIISVKTRLFISIPIHNNDCKLKYKRKLKKFYELTK